MNRAEMKMVYSGYDVLNTRLTEHEAPPEDQTGGGGNINAELSQILAGQTDEQMEALLDLFGYRAPRAGELLNTGDEIPPLKYAFTGAGALALMLFLILGRKRKNRGL